MFWRIYNLEFIIESTWKSQESSSNSKYAYFLLYYIINKHVYKGRIYDVITEMRLLIYKMKVIFWRTTFSSGFNITFSYLNRIHIATFLPFRAYNTDNQLIIDTMTVRGWHQLLFHHLSLLWGKISSWVVLIWKLFILKVSFHLQKITLIWVYYIIVLWKFL